MGEEDGTKRGRSPAVVPGRTDDGGAIQLHRPDRGSDLDLTPEVSHDASHAHLSPLTLTRILSVLSLFVVVVPGPALARRANRAAGTTRHG